MAVNNEFERSRRLIEHMSVREMPYLTDDDLATHPGYKPVVWRVIIWEVKTATRPVWRVWGEAQIAPGAVATVGTDIDPFTTRAAARDRAERLARVLGEAVVGGQWIIRLVRADGTNELVASDGCWRAHASLVQGAAG